MKKKGFILVELRPTASDKEFIKHVQAKYLTGRDYCCSVVGKFHVVIEKNFEELKDVDELVTRIRNDPVLAGSLANTTTFLGTQQAS